MDEKKLDELMKLACQSGPIYAVDSIEDALREAYRLGDEAGYKRGRESMRDEVERKLSFASCCCSRVVEEIDL